MRRAWGLAAALLLAGSVGAQEPATPDVPAGDAAIEGRVVEEAAGGGVADVGVILYSLRADGEPGLRQTRTDAEGRFRFDGVSGDPEVVYLVGARVGGVPFGARVVFDAGSRLEQAVIEVAQPSRDVGPIVRGLPQLRLERGCSHLRVHHHQPLTNPSERVVFVAPDARDGARPVFELRLPEAATAIETPVGTASDGFEREGRTLRFFGPVYPGTTEIEFSYGLPLAPGPLALAVAFADGTSGARVLVPSGTHVRGERLREEGELPLAMGVHRTLLADALAAGETLELEVALDEAPADDAVSVGEARVWLELDDAALDVSELYQLRVEGDAPAASAAPLLCIPLPDGAESLRFSNASLALGLSRDPGGALAISGPVPPGDTPLSLRYRLPTGPGPFSFERTFQSDVDLLTLLIADTGIVPETERLHRRRPIRTEDRSYLHLEGFGIEAGERVEVALRTLPQRQGLPSLATTGLVLLLAIGALLYLVAPLRREATAAAEPATAPPVDDGAGRLADERQAVYAAIEDLDDDFQTGKLSAEDHERMRAELRARAVVLLQQERDLQRAAAATRARPAATVAPAGCARCGATASEGDRFCSQCGASLAPAPRSGSRAT